MDFVDDRGCDWTEIFTDMEFTGAGISSTAIKVLEPIVGPVGGVGQNAEGCVFSRTREVVN